MTLENLDMRINRLERENWKLRDALKRIQISAECILSANIGDPSPFEKNTEAKGKE